MTHFEEQRGSPGCAASSEALVPPTDQTHCFDSCSPLTAASAPQCGRDLIWTEPEFRIFATHAIGKKLLAELAGPQLDIIRAQEERETHQKAVADLEYDVSQKAQKLPWGQRLFALFGVRSHDVMELDGLRGKLNWLKGSFVLETSRERTKQLVRHQNDSILKAATEYAEQTCRVPALAELCESLRACFATPAASTADDRVQVVKDTRNNRLKLLAELQDLQRLGCLNIRNDVVSKLVGQVQTVLTHLAPNVRPAGSERCYAVIAHLNAAIDNAAGLPKSAEASVNAEHLSKTISVFLNCLNLLLPEINAEAALERKFKVDRVKHNVTRWLTQKMPADPGELQQ